MSPVIQPSMPVVLFQLAAVIARGELPEPLQVEITARGGVVQVALVLAEVRHLHWWARRCGPGAEQTVAELPFDLHGVPHTLTTAHGHFTGAYIHLSICIPTGGTP